MNKRPHIKIFANKTDGVIEKISLILLLLLWMFSLFSFVKLPEIIPIHFDAAGRPDNYGSKWALFLLPIIASLLYAALTYLNKYPHIFNYMVEITEENAESQYSLATRMIRVVKCSIMMVFSIIVLYSYWTGEGKTELPGWWLLPLVLGIIFIPIIYHFINYFKVQKKSSQSRK